MAKEDEPSPFSPPGTVGKEEPCKVGVNPELAFKPCARHGVDEIAGVSTVARYGS